MIKFIFLQALAFGEVMSAVLVLTDQNAFNFTMPDTCAVQRCALPRREGTFYLEESPLVDQ